jgi:hypothetical protein
MIATSGDVFLSIIPDAVEMIIPSKANRLAKKFVLWSTLRLSPYPVNIEFSFKFVFWLDLS